MAVGGVEIIVITNKNVYFSALRKNGLDIPIYLD